jgi:hypothetical protein
MKPVVATALALALSLSACLEIEETVEVRADGSVSVSVRAKGDPEDLAAGFPLPTWGAWRAADDVTLAWLAGQPLPQDAEAVRVTADFGSVADLPRWWAPPTEPYRSAYLERTTELQVLRRGTRTVYVFTRRIGARRFRDLSPAARIDAGLDEDLRAALEAQENLTPQQWERAVGVVREAYREACLSQARAALVGIYVEGDAALPLAAHGRALARVEQAVGGAITEERLRRLYSLLHNASAAPEKPRVEIPPELDLDLAAREALRSALPAALAQAGVAEAVRNAVLERLEWGFTSLDQTTDLGDEGLLLRLHLPGRIVEGNFADLDEDGAAVFAVQGQDLHEREVVWRAVSVVE